jgi:hypothetical protein
MFQRKWLNTSGIYKITFLPLMVFSYYGFSQIIREKIKYHYYNKNKQNKFSGLFF